MPHPRSASKPPGTPFPGPFPLAAAAGGHDMAALEAEMRVLAEQLQVVGWLRGWAVGLGCKPAAPLLHPAVGRQPCCETAAPAAPLVPAPSPAPLLDEMLQAQAPDLTDEEMQQQNPLAALLRSMLPWVNLGQAPDAAGEGGEGGGQQ